MTTEHSCSGEERQNFYSKRNSCTRIDVFEELSPTAEAALREFFRRVGAPQYVDEVVIPTLRMGDAQVYATIRDRPWPPWGLGARTISAVCLTHNVTPESWAMSPVFVVDEEATNIGLVCALYKEVLEGLAISKTAEVCYLAAEGSVLGDQVLRENGFRRDDDVFLTEHARYFTYRTPAYKLLKELRLDHPSVPDLLAHDFPEQTLVRNALYHHSILLGARPSLTDRSIPEIIDLARGGHASKPGGVPGGTGTELGTDQFGGLRGHLPYVSLGRFLGSDARDLLKNVLRLENRFEKATVLHEGAERPVVDDRMRRALTLDDVEFIESAFVELLKGALPGAMTRMGIEGFPIGRIELQVTASGDGDYYRMHRDADQKSTRALSFVYFFHSEPRQFYGGELRLYDHRRLDEGAHDDCSHLLSPRQDMLVIFPSRAPHELLPVRVPSQKFADNRFTLNGWIHRGDER